METYYRFIIKRGVEIKIAGKTNTYKIPVIMDENKNYMCFRCIKNKLGDFKLKHQQKL